MIIATLAIIFFIYYDDICNITKYLQKEQVFLLFVIILGSLLIISMDITSKKNDPLILGGESDRHEKYMRMELMDPKHNLREIAKQMILIEDHMAHDRKRCVDCITKHYLMVEGLLEEAITLDKKNEHTDEIRSIINKIKPVMMGIIEKIKQSKIKEEDYQEACQILRTIRKSIALKYVLNN